MYWVMGLGYVVQGCLGSVGGGVVELSSVRVFIELLHGFLWFRKR